MVEDKNLIIDKRTFDISFYEMEIPFDNTSLLEVIKNTKMEQLQMLTSYEKDNNVLNKENMNDFKNHLFYFLDLFTKKILQLNSFEVTYSWIQCYSKDSYHPLHIHGTDPNQWSLIYYIQVSENSSNTEIYGPGHPYIDFPKKTIQPKTNKLVIFPSCLPHEVPKNEDDKRIILSANLNID
jgi:hypothetical protein